MSIFIFYLHFVIFSLPFFSFLFIDPLFSLFFITYFIPHFLPDIFERFLHFPVLLLILYVGYFFFFLKFFLDLIVPSFKSSCFMDGIASFISPTLCRVSFPS